MLFKIEHHEMPMPTSTNEEKEAFWNQLMTELPHWLHHLTQWEIPADIKANRFGVKHYHHPDIVDAIDSLSPQTKFYNMVRSLFLGAHRPPMPWTGTAAELEELLKGRMAHSPREAIALLHWATACGTYLSDAAKRHPEHIRRANRLDNQHQWIIDFTPNREEAVKVEPGVVPIGRIPAPPVIVEPGAHPLPENLGLAC